jgi:hypothetical protein
VPNPYGSAGNPLANSPPFQANLRARYEFTVGELKAFIFGQNLTNVLASTFTNSPQWIEQEAVTRPRVAGLKFG